VPFVPKRQLVFCANGRSIGRFFVLTISTIVKPKQTGNLMSTTPLSNAVPTYREIGGVPHLNTEQAAERLAISTQTLPIYASAGKPVRPRGSNGVITYVTLPRVRLGNAYFYKLGDVDNFVEECRAVETGACRQLHRARMSEPRA
jgi:hypothetical protein